MGTATDDLRVLLFSPVRGRDPAGGDVTYTEILLADPPPGVRYTPYDEAVAAGSVRLLDRRPDRLGAWTPQHAAAAVVGRAHRLAAGRVAYREPPVFVELEPGRFDVVHQHDFGLRLLGDHPPSVLTSGMPLAALYAQREGWSAGRLRRADALRRTEARLLGLRVPGVTAGPGTLSCVYTERYARHVAAATGQPARVVRQGAPRRSRPRPPHPVTAAYVGGDWARKGGDLALGLLRQLVADGSVERGLVLTRDPAAVDARGLDPAVSVGPLVPRATLLDEVLPTVDLLLLPTRADCGVPYTVLEALGAGARVLLGPSPWLDPALAGPGVGVSDLAPGALLTAAHELLGHPAAEVAAHREHVLGLFSLDALHDGLGRAYRDVTADRGR